MGSKPKTRFAACIDGRDVELFCVQDRDAKGVVLVSEFPKYFEHKNETLVEFREQHYSVHASNGGLDTTVTQKTFLANDGSVSNVAFIQGTRDHLLWPVYARRPPIFSPDRRLISRSNDTVINIGKYDTGRATAFYSVFVANRDFLPLVRSTEAVSLHVSHFKIFQIVVLVTYLNLPSLHQGDVAGWSTSPEVHDDKLGEGHFQLTANPIPPGRLLDVHWALVAMLRDRMAQRVQKQIDHDDSAYNFFLARSQHFSPIPAG